MVRVNCVPFLLLVDRRIRSVNKVASESINATFLIQERIAVFCFVGNVHLSIAPKLVCPMSELTFISVRTQPFLCKILAQRALDFSIL